MCLHDALYNPTENMKDSAASVGLGVISQIENCHIYIYNNNKIDILGSFLLIRSGARYKRATWALLIGPSTLTGA